jgi:hypothetical protein
VQDGVILTNPARAATLAGVLRNHLIQLHALRMSAEQRESKIGALYAYITSDGFIDRLAQIDTLAEELLEQQVKEKRQHDAHWKKNGELVRSIQKAQASITNEVGLIIGTEGDDTDAQQNDSEGTVFG